MAYIYKNFQEEGVDISFRLNGGGGFGFFPSLQELIVGTDLRGKRGNFLVNLDDYQFIRQMHQKNLIIPVVGDFGGKKAIATVADFLKKNSLNVNVFYTSNVEQYLFESDVFVSFAENVRKLPVTDKSLFIRSVFDIAGPHPAQIPGHNVTTIMQYMNTFVRDFDQKKYPSYWSLVTINYLSAERPR